MSDFMPQARVPEGPAVKYKYKMGSFYRAPCITITLYRVADG